MIHHRPLALADPVPDRALDLRLQQSASPPSHALAGSRRMCAELDRYGIAVVLEAAFVWGGDRYPSAADAIAAAKRVCK